MCSALMWVEVEVGQRGERREEGGKRGPSSIRCRVAKDQAKDEESDGREGTNRRRTEQSMRVGHR